MSFSLRTLKIAAVFLMMAPFHHALANSYGATIVSPQTNFVAINNERDGGSVIVYQIQPDSSRKICTNTRMPNLIFANGGFVLWG